MCSKKDYVGIAMKIKSVRVGMPGSKASNPDVVGAIDSVAIRIANYFEDDSPKFNRTRFLEACGVTA